MRVAVWNLERTPVTHRRARSQRAVVTGVEADIWVLTEAPVDLRLPANPGAALSVAATVRVEGSELVMYASVLPWMGSSAVLSAEITAGKKGAELFCHVLEHQLADLRALRDRYPTGTLIWGGDFNQSFTGRNSGGSTIGRQALVAALDELNLVAWTAEAQHARPGYSSIDHLCGPAYLSPVKITRWAGDDGLERLSDHAGYAVDFDHEILQ